MLDLFLLWGLVEVLGVLCLPLSFILLHNLPDRGWAFSKVLSIIVVAFCIWLPLLCIPVLPYSRWFIATVVLLLGTGGGYAVWRMRQELQAFVRRNRAYVILVEIVFTGMMVLLGFLRTFDPNIQGFEMYMDEGFVSAIMRSPHFPPNDMWLSGYSINYYYYAHYTIATLAKLLGQSSSIAFNTGISLFFGLTAVNLFGTACNIVAWSRRYRQSALILCVERSELLVSTPFGGISVLMGLILGNLAATQQWWQEHGNAGYRFNWFTPSRVIDNTINEFPAFSFLLSCFHSHVLTMAFTILCIALAFNWLLADDVQGLALFGKGWRLSLNLGLTAIILGGLFTMNGWDYPTYISLTLVCIIVQQGFACKKAHHSLFHWSLPYNIALVSLCVIALSYVFYLPFYLHFISPSQGIGLADASLRSPLSGELLIYGLFAFIFLSLLLGSALKRPLRVVTLKRMSLAVDTDTLSTTTDVETVPASATAIFSACGRNTSATNLSRSTSYTGGSAQIAKQRLNMSLAPVARRTLVAVTPREGVPEPVASIKQADVSMQEEASVVADTVSAEKKSPEVETSSFKHTLKYTLASPVWQSWILRAVLIGVVAFLLLGLILFQLIPNDATLIVCSELVLLSVVLLFYHVQDRAHAFTLLCGAAAFTIIAGCEVFYLKDIFAGGGSERMNTIFKFYFQAWALLSIGSAAGLYYIWNCFWPVRSQAIALRWLQRCAVTFWAALLLLLIAAEMVYPIVAPYARLVQTDVLHTLPYLSTNFDLDGLTYMATCAPPNCDFATEGDYNAIRWLNAHVAGDPVIVEALGDDYRYNGRVSTFTGLPTPMGWVGHEAQWRVNWLNAPGTNHQFLFNQRSSDVEQIYMSTSQLTVIALMRRYNARYLYVGPYKYKKYGDAQLDRYSAFMQPVYSNDGVTIYKVK